MSDIMNTTSHLNLQDGPYILTKANQKQIMSILPSNGPYSLGNVHIRFPTFSPTGLWGAPENDFEHYEGYSYYWGRGYYWGGYTRWPHWNRYPWNNLINLATENGDFMTRERITKIRNTIKNWIERPYTYHHGGPYWWGRYGYWGGWGNHWNWGEYMTQLSQTLIKSAHSPINGIEPWLLPYIIPGQFDVSASKWRSSIPGRAHWNYEYPYYYRSSALLSILYSNGDLYSLKAQWGGRDRWNWQCGITAGVNGIDGIMSQYRGYRPYDINAPTPNPPGNWQLPYDRPWRLDHAEYHNIRPGTTDPIASMSWTNWNWPSGAPAQPGGCFGHSTCWERRFKGLTRDQMSEDCGQHLQAVWVEHYNINDNAIAGVSGYGMGEMMGRYGNGGLVQAGKINEEGGAMEVPMGYAASVSISENDITHQWKKHGWGRWGWMYNYWDWWYGWWWTPYYWWGVGWYSRYYGYPYYYNWYYYGYWRWPWYRWYWWAYYWQSDQNSLFQPGGHFNTSGGGYGYSWNPWWWMGGRPTWGLKNNFSAAYQNKLRAKMGSRHTTHHRVDFALHWNTGIVHSASSGNWYGHEDIAMSGLCHPDYGLENVSCAPFSGVDISAVGGLLWHSMHHYKNAYTGVRMLAAGGGGGWGNQPVESGRPLLTTNDCGLSNAFHFPTGKDGIQSWYRWPYWQGGACETGFLWPQRDGMQANPAWGDTWFSPRPNAGQTNDNQFVALKDGWDSFFESNRTFAGQYVNMWDSIPNGGRITGSAINTIGNVDAQGNWDGTYSYREKSFTGFSHNWESQQPWYNSMAAGQSFTWPAPQTHNPTWPGTWSPTPTEGTNQTFYQLAMPGPTGRVGPPVYSPQNQVPWFPPVGNSQGSGAAQDWAFSPHPDHMQPVTTSGFNDFIIDFITGVCTGSQYNTPNAPFTEGCRWNTEFFTGCWKSEDGCLEHTTRGYLLIDYQFPNLRGAGTANVYVRDHYWPINTVPIGTNPVPPRKLVASFTQSLIQQANDNDPSQANDPFAWQRNPRGYVSPGRDYCFVQQSGTRQAWIPIGPAGATQIPDTGRLCDHPLPHLRGWDQCSQYGFYVNHSKVLHYDKPYWVGGWYGFYIPWYYNHFVPHVETRVIDTPQFDTALDAVSIIPNQIYIVEVDLDYTAKVPVNESWDGGTGQVGLPYQHNGIPPNQSRNIWSHTYYLMPTKLHGPIDCSGRAGNTDCVGEKTVQIKETYIYNQYLRAYAFDSCIGMYPRGNDRPLNTSATLPLNGYEMGNNVANGYADIGATYWNLGHQYPTGFYKDLWRPQGYWHITSPDAMATMNSWSACNTSGPYVNYNIFSYPQGPPPYKPCPNWGCDAFGVMTWRKMHPPNQNTLWVGQWPPMPCGVPGKAQTNFAEGKLEMFKMTAQQGGGFTQGAKVFEKDFAVANNTWGNHQPMMDFYIPGDKCLCVGTGNAGWLGVAATHGNFWEKPILKAGDPGASFGYGLHAATAYAGDQYLPQTAKIDNSYDHYKFKWSFDFFRKETKWDPYPYGLTHSMYKPVGVCKYENEWTGLSPTHNNCTYVTWTTQQCGGGVAWSQLMKIGWYGSKNNCNCTCRGNGYFNFWEAHVIDHKKMPNYNDYVAGKSRFGYGRPNWMQFFHSPLYKGLEFKVTKGGTSYTLN